MNARVFVLAAFALGIADRAAACAVCFGDPASDQTRALMVAMGILLGVTLAVLSAVALFGYRVLWQGDAAAEAATSDVPASEG